MRIRERGHEAGDGGAELYEVRSREAVGFRAGVRYRCPRRV